MPEGLYSAIGCLFWLGFIGLVLLLLGVVGLLVFIALKLAGAL